jgi:predicted membrane protein
MLFRSVLRTEDAPLIVVIGLQAIFMTSHKPVFPFSNVQRFRCLKIHYNSCEYFHAKQYAAWLLTFATQMLFRHSVSELFDIFTNIILRIFPLLNIYLLWPGIIDARAWYWAAARRLRNTGLQYVQR